MDIIITHVNADFDAFASMVAAKKLYPEALVAFPGSQEKNLRDFFMESTLYILSIERAKDIDLAKIRRLILVDTRQKHRIGRFAELANDPNVEIHIYDHHPDSEEDVHGSKEIIREVGATVTILIRLLREQGVELNAEEATVLALGLYEDTGSFTFSSTTPEDMAAAQWLLEKGANLNIIANMMQNELSRDQIEVLYQLIEESETLNFGGIDVIVTTAGADGYVGDLAVLVHKFRDIENVDAIFALARIDDRVHLIARSSTEEVNAGEIAAEFGGGGHPTAASATIRNLTLYEARDRVIELLKEKVRPKRSAREIMSRPVISVAPETSIEEAAEQLARYQISSLPVVRDGAIQGIVHRNALERASHHGLKDLPVHEYMNPGVVFVTPDEPLERILRMTVENRYRLVPVIDQGTLVGVISRSDLLEHLKIPSVGELQGPDGYPSARLRSKSIRKLMEERVPPKILQLLRTAGETAAGHGQTVYLVGGAVRDLLLRNHNLDLDLVVEGDGISFAHTLAERFPGTRVRDHAKFGTAVLLFPDGVKIDVATARHEYYERPGALPMVEMSSIKRDLYRRDFTINTLAVNLAPKNFGAVIDFFGGSRDLKERVIRVLHNLAFVEDPTRILRAVRFSARFGFQMGKHTMNLIKAALRMNIFDSVEGKRLLNELILILDEKNPLPTLAQMAAYSIPQSIHPALQFGPKSMQAAESVAGVLAWWKYQAMQDKIETWVVYFFGLIDHLSDDEFREVSLRLSVPNAQIDRWMRDRAQSRFTLSMMAKGAPVRTSEIVSALRPISIETLLFMMAKTQREQSRHTIANFLNTLRHVKPALTGKDLIEMGRRPGPLFQKILTAVRDARLDGEVFGYEDEKRLVEALFPIYDAQSQ